MLKSSIFDIVKTMLRNVYEILKDILNVNIQTKHLMITFYFIQNIDTLNWIKQHIKCL